MFPNFEFRGTLESGLKLLGRRHFHSPKVKMANEKNRPRTLGRLSSKKGRLCDYFTFKNKSLDQFS
jgi:hypothetical protein